MIATVVIETTLALYTVWRYKMNIVTRLTVLVFGCLAIFQLAEFFVCTGYGDIPGRYWSRLGFAAITALPPLGLHLLHVLGDKPGRRLVRTCYATMVVFVTALLTIPATFNDYQCTGNYVIFHLQQSFDTAYGIYYAGWQSLAVALGVLWALELKIKSKAARTKLQLIQAVIVSYLVFLIPVGVVNVIHPASHAGTPSIMCGFAVVMALILGLYILPRTGEVKALTKPHHKVSLK